MRALYYQDEESGVGGAIELRMIPTIELKMVPEVNCTQYTKVVQISDNQAQRIAKYYHGDWSHIYKEDISGRYYVLARKCIARRRYRGLHPLVHRYHLDTEIGRALWEGVAS